MAKKLFLLDGMALVYRAHFAFMRNPIMNSAGLNTSAVFGFTNTLLEILEKQEPSHLAIAFDSPEETEREVEYEDYKANREEMPEDIEVALPLIHQLAETMNIPVLEYPGYEADDIIGTVAVQAEKKGFETYMVTPDKDFAQLVTDTILIYKPPRGGGDPEILGVAEIKEKWNVQETEHVADILGLWGDSSDNIPGVPGIGEKTAKKLIGEYGTLENLLEHTNDLKGKQKENLVEFQEQARMSKRLATIIRDVPVKESLADYKLRKRNDEALKDLFAELEFNSLGKRLFGNDFSPGRQTKLAEERGVAQGELLLADVETVSSVKHNYKAVTEPSDLARLSETLLKQKSFCFDLETDSLDTKVASIVGFAFSYAAHEGFYVPVPEDSGADPVIDALRPVFANSSALKIGHNLKFDISVLKWNDIAINGPLGDTLIAHFLIDPEARHNMDYLSEVYFNYSPISITKLIGEKKTEQISMRDVPLEQITEYAAEDADITWRLWEKLVPQVKEAGQEKVFYDIELPLLQVLVDMQVEGITLDKEALKEISGRLATKIEELEKRIYDLAGEEFNLNSPKQLGVILFEKLAIVKKAKKTKTGQYATNEQVLSGLRGQHEIVAAILDYREASKLKNTYVDTLPENVFEKTGRIHTTFHQTGAATGRLASSNPNLQNIPIRTEMGREIRKAFVPRGEGFVILSADYSQIELRVMAEMSKDKGLRDAFEAGLDIHSATAANVYDVELTEVTEEMRRKAKMVNFGIIYGISAFGLSQRLGVPRKEAHELIEQYFENYPKVKTFMDATVEFCEEHGYVETMTGRRRYIRDINSANGTTKSAAERTAINSPIQGSAADLIKLAMFRVHNLLNEGSFKTRMLLQVHDELVFDLYESEQEKVCPLIEEAMRTALPMDIPVVVEMGTGVNWLEAH